MTTSETFRKARNRGVPIVGIETQDPAATRRWVLTALNGTAPPFVTWDCIQGFTGDNDAGQALAQDWQPELPILNPAEALDTIARKLPDKALAVFSNAQRFISETPIMQAIWNCRDALKARGAMLLLTGPALQLPPELTNDVVILTEPLPNEIELGTILDSTLTDAKIKADGINRPLAVDTLRGISAYAAENTLALALSKTGIDQEALWQGKAKMIEQTPGLQVWKGQEQFSDIGGNRILIEYLQKIATSKTVPVRAILFADEIEKALAGSTGDTSGTSQDQLGAILAYFQDNNTPILLLIGPGGTGKSMIAKASGTVAKAPVLAIDFGAMKSSLVGSSEARIRQALAVALAVSDGKMIAIMTCNKIGNLPPEFRRRCTLGTFFVDLPTAEERAAIWPIWIKKYGLKDSPLPETACKNWTGAEIRACCDSAYRLGIPLAEAADNVLPIATSAGDQIDALRKSASGKFRSSSYKGAYKYSPAEQATGRKMEL